MALLLLHENATVTIHSKTPDLPKICREADPGGSHGSRRHADGGLSARGDGSGCGMNRIEDRAEANVFSDTTRKKWLP